MEIRSVDVSQYPQLHEAIGRVMFSSAAFSDALQQLAATVVGSDLVYFLLEDKTLGAQLNDVLTLVTSTNQNQYVQHPSITDSDREDALELLKSSRYFVELRNRVAHDEWSPVSTMGFDDGVQGSRTTRWPKAGVVTTIRSFNLLDQTLFRAAMGLQSVDRAVKRSRSGGPSLRTSSDYDDFRSHLDDMVAIARGEDEVWTWKIDKSPYR